MMVVPTVKARTYHGFMSTGATLPGLFTCACPDGSEDQYVVKCHSKLGRGSAYELMASLLAEHFQLPTPAPALVEVPFMLLAYIPDKDVRDNVCGTNFGSRYIEGWQMMGADFPLRESQIPTALRVFAFDMLIQNADRLDGQRNGAGKANLLYRGDQMLLIDHEKAFSFIGAIGDPPPWDLRPLRFTQFHLFRRHLMTQDTSTICFDEFMSALAMLTDPVLETLAQQVPTSWNCNQAVSTIVTHLRVVRDHIREFERGLREVLA